MRLQRIVVTNDDGIDAPGLAVAEAIAHQLADEVWTFAPALDQSGMAQALSMHQPLRIVPHGARRFSVSGTPADCVMAALADDPDGLRMGGQAPDLVLSGVNWGANLSDSVMYSGTVGAALTAAHFGLPAVALSQLFTQRDHIDFAPAQAHAATTIEHLWTQRETLGCCWNINFPMRAPADIAGLRFVRQVGGSMQRPSLVSRSDGRGMEYHWLSFARNWDAIVDAAADVTAIRDARVAVMPLMRERCDETRLSGAGVCSEFDWPGAGD